MFATSRQNFVWRKIVLDMSQGHELTYCKNRKKTKNFK